MQPLVFLPQPRTLTRGNGELTLATNRRIVLEAPVGADLVGAAKRLQATLSQIGVTWQLSATAFGNSSEIGAILRVAPERVARPQGYELTIAPEHVLVEAHDPAGIFYGVCTLIQIIEQTGAHLPTLQISDWPDFPARGVMLDISRDKVPTLATLFELVDMLASWKINQLQLYTEHTFAYARHPEVWANASPITGQDILLLDAFCRERFVELVPNQATFGHMNRWLPIQRYRDLAETHDEFNTPWGTTMPGPFTLFPDHPGSIALVRELFEELLPHFTSHTVNINCDETFDLGQGRSRDLTAERGVGRVYLEFLRQVINEAQRHDRHVQFWGDIIMEHPELVFELPQGVTALEWGYEADHPFAEHAAHFAASGIPFYVCPGTSSWCSLAGRTTNALGNLQAAAEHGLRNGAVGFLNTDWGDLGHWQHLPVSFLGFVAGAAYSWAWEANRDMDVVAPLNLFAFRDTAGVMGKLAYDLGDVYHAVGDASRNSTQMFWLLQLPLSKFSNTGPLSPDMLHQALGMIDDVIARLNEARMQRPDAAQIVREFQQTARMMRHACQRGLLLSDTNAGDAETRRMLARDMGAIIEEQRRLWLARNRSGGLSDSLARLSRTLDAYQ